MFQRIPGRRLWLQEQVFQINILVIYLDMITSYYWNVTGLASQLTYYWRVVAVNGQQMSSGYESFICKKCSDIGLTSF